MREAVTMGTARLTCALAAFCLWSTPSTSSVPPVSWEEGSDEVASVSLSQQGQYGHHDRQLPTQAHANERRVRRQAPANQDKRGFEDWEKRILVGKHNSLRRLARASDMMYMYWDNDLEALAQDWAANCDFSHRPNRKNIGAFSYAGENLYAGTDGYGPAEVLQLWYDEVEFYNYNTRRCSKEPCGHYTQMVWAASKAVGCGVAYCPVLRNVHFNRGFHVVCNYGPGGNYVGQRPYKAGQPCSQCGEEATFCLNGLCSQFPVIEDGTDGAARLSPALTLTVAPCLLLALSFVGGNSIT